MERRSLVEYLPDFLRRGQEIAYVQRSGYRTVRRSYQEVAESAFQFARELEARGINKGDRVLLWGPNSAEWVAVFLGCALRGVVVVPIDDVAATEFTLRVHQQVSARLVVCSREHASASGSDITARRARSVVVAALLRSLSSPRRLNAPTPCRLFSLQARPRIPRALSSRMAMFSRTWHRWRRRLRSISSTKASSTRFAF